MKKILSLILIFALNFITIMPTLAKNSDLKVDKTMDSETIEADSVLHVEFNQDFNINKADVGDTIEFILPKAITDNDGTVLPAGTRFIATVESKTDSKWAFRRAKANIVVDRMVMPDGVEYDLISKVRANKLNAPEALNVTKALATTAVAGGVCMVGAIVIAIEALSIGGLIFAPYTGAAIGLAFGLTSKGLNYKARKGTKIVIKLQEPVSIDLSEVRG